MIRNFLSDWSVFPSPLRRLLIAVVLTGVSTFMLLPLLSLRLAAGGQYAQAGLVLSILVFSQQAGGPIMGHFVDRLGVHRMLLCGLIVRAIAYAALAFLVHSKLVVICAVAIGLGGAAVSLPIRLEFMALAPDLRRPAMAIRGMAVNAGALVGPAVGGALANLPFWLVCSFAVGIQLLVLVLLRPASSAHTTEERPEGSSGAMPWRVAIRQILRPALFALVVATVCFWYGYSQLNSTMTWSVRDLLGTDQRVAIMFIGNAAIVLLLEYPIIRGLSSRVASRTTLVFGLVSLGVAFLAWGVSHSLVGFICMVVLFSLGEIFFSSSMDDAVSHLTDGSRGRIVGLFGIADALGSVLGASLGARLYVATPDNNHSLYWILLSLAIIGCGLLVFATIARRVHA